MPSALLRFHGSSSDMRPRRSPLAAELDESEQPPRREADDPARCCLPRVRASPHMAATLARAHQQASRNRNRRRKQLLLPRRREQSGARWRAAGSINRCALLTADSEASERFAATARHRRAYCRRPKASRCLPPTLTPDKPRSPVRKVRRPVPAPSPAAPRCVHSAATDAASAVVIAVGLSVLVALDFALATFHSSKIYES